MKSISHYIQAFVLVLAVSFTLLFMNFISAIMVIQSNKNIEEEVTSDAFEFAGFEVRYS